VHKVEFLKVATNDFVKVVTINHQPANALSQAVLKELSSVLREAENDSNTRVVLLHGEGRFFCAGADIKEFTTLESADDYAQLAKFGQELMEYIETYPKPVIAAIHGAALGGGLELAMSCHIRLVSEKAKLGLPELQLGIIPGFAGTQRLPRYVGTGRAAQMMLTSEPISGVEAAEVGLANYAYPDESLMDEATKLAAKIALKSPISVKYALQLLQHSKPASYYEGVEKEAELFGQVFGSQDAKEGIAAFVEKRAPKFTGE